MAEPFSPIWINSAGGPYLVLEERLVPLWNGGGENWEGPADDGTPRSDYDRACAADQGDGNDDVNLIPVGDGHALVLGDEPHQTAWWPVPGCPGGALLVRWGVANSHEEVAAALRFVQANLGELRSDGLKLVTSSSRLRLFDSGQPGSWPVEPGELWPMNPGTYELRSWHYKPKESLRLRLHLLAPSS